MSTHMKPTDPKQPKLSEKALRLLAAHDREIRNFDLFDAKTRPANRWA